MNHANPLLVRTPATQLLQHAHASRQKRRFHAPVGNDLCILSDDEPADKAYYGRCRTSSWTHSHSPNSLDRRPCGATRTLSFQASRPLMPSLVGSFLYRRQKRRSSRRKPSESRNRYVYHTAQLLCPTPTPIPDRTPTYHPLAIREDIYFFLSTSMLS